MTPQFAKTIVFMLAQLEHEISQVPPEAREEAWTDSVQNARDQAVQWRGQNFRESLMGMAAKIGRCLYDNSVVPLEHLRTELAVVLREFDEDSNKGYARNIKAITDRVIELITKPMARQLITESELMGLRKALLDPNEFSKVLLDESSPLICPGCHRLMGSGQGMTMIVKGGSPMFYCTSCVGISRKFCNTYRCDETVLLNQTTCDRCRTRENQPAPNVAEPDVLIPAPPARGIADMLNEQVNVVRQGRGPIPDAPQVRQWIENPMRRRR